MEEGSSLSKGIDLLHSVCSGCRKTLHHWAAKEAERRLSQADSGWEGVRCAWSLRVFSSSGKGLFLPGPCLCPHSSAVPASVWDSALVSNSPSLRSYRCGLRWVLNLSSFMFIVTKFLLRSYYTCHSLCWASGVSGGHDSSPPAIKSTQHWYHCLGLLARECQAQLLRNLCIFTHL